MNPVWFEIGSLQVHAYDGWLVLGALAALGMIAAVAYRQNPDYALPWLDVGLAALVGGVIGARALHVGLEWRYFSDHTGEITDLGAGGLAWHGALLTGIPAALLMARLRRVALRPWADAAALAWPLALSAGWLACRRAGCAYGREVATLAEWPSWQVEELPDIYGIITPRFELQLGGALFGLGLLIVVGLLAWRGWLPGLRLWIVWALTGAGLFLLDGQRADPAQTLFDLRADRFFDLGLLIASVVIGSLIWLADRRGVPSHSGDPGESIEAGL